MNKFDPKDYEFITAERSVREANENMSACLLLDTGDIIKTVDDVEGVVLANNAEEAVLLVSFPYMGNLFVIGHKRRVVPYAMVKSERTDPVSQEEYLRAEALFLINKMREDGDEGMAALLDICDQHGIDYSPFGTRAELEGKHVQ